MPPRSHSVTAVIQTHSMKTLIRSIEISYSSCIFKRMHIHQFKRIKSIQSNALNQSHCTVLYAVTVSHFESSMK